MRKVLLFSSLFLFVFILGCGGGGRSTTSPVTQTSAFPFLQQASAGQVDWVTPMIGTFSVTGNNVQFSAVPAAKDVNGKPVSGYFASIASSPDGKKATFDLWGGTVASPSSEFDIWVANSDGTGLFQVTNDAFDDATPQFSPNGGEVVFVSDRGSGYQVVIRTVNGTGEFVPPIPAGVLDEFFPTFSPDGTKIAMYAWGNDPNTGNPFNGILVFNVDGSNPRVLTNPMSPNCFCWDETPAFSSDGSKIYFSRIDAMVSSVEDVYVVNSDGTGATRLTDSIGMNRDPLLFNVFGMGPRLLFSSNRSNATDLSGSSFDMYSMGATGGNITRLTSNSLYDGFAMWIILGSASASQRPAAEHRQFASRVSYPVHRPNWR